MKWCFFSITAKLPEAGQDALNGFCARHRVVAVEKQFVPQGAESYWSICVTYQEGGEQGVSPSNPKRDRLDYREVLSEPDFYLDGADRWLLGHPSVCAHVRYMDDMVWWCQGKEEAKQVLAGLTAYLHEARGLHIKPAVQINRSPLGMTYCGYRILPDAVLLTPRKRHRYRSLRQHWEAEWRAGRIDSLKLQAAYAAVHAITFHAHSRTWRQNHLRLHPTSWDD